MSIDAVIPPVLFIKLFVVEIDTQQTFWYPGSHNLPVPFLKCSLSHRFRSSAADVPTETELLKNLLAALPTCVVISFFVMVFTCNDRLLG